MRRPCACALRNSAFSMLWFMVVWRTQTATHNVCMVHINAMCVHNHGFDMAHQQPLNDTYFVTITNNKQRTVSAFRSRLGLCHRNQIRRFFFFFLFFRFSPHGHRDNEFHCLLSSLEYIPLKSITQVFSGSKLEVRKMKSIFLVVGVRMCVCMDKCVLAAHSPSFHFDQLVLMKIAKQKLSLGKLSDIKI